MNQGQFDLNIVNFLSLENELGRAQMLCYKPKPSLNQSQFPNNSVCNHINPACGSKFFFFEEHGWKPSQGCMVKVHLKKMQHLIKAVL